MVNINRQYLINPGTGHTIGKIAVVHSTATAGNPPATNFGIAFHRDWRKTQTFVHYFVDDTNTVVQVAEEGVVAWGAGYANKYAPLQVELCEYSDRTRALKAYHNFVNFVAARCRALGIPLTLDDGNKTAGIKSHNWCSQNYGGSDHTDPYGYLAKIGISKAQLAKDLGAATASVSVTPAPAAKPSQSAAGDLEVDGYFGAKSARRAEALEKRAQDGVISSQDIAWTDAKGYRFIDARALPAVQWVSSTSAVGSQLVGIWQQRLGLPVDYKIGPDFYHAALRYYGFKVDNSWTSPSNLVKAMQRQLNKGQKLFS